METITDEHPTVRQDEEEATETRPLKPAQPEEAAAPSPRTPLRAALVAIRPPEWIKNVLVFAGLMFGRKFHDPGAVVDATSTFIAFCAISSAGYLINDLNDVEFDRAHPSKRNRPIARGELSDGRLWAAVALTVAALASPSPP
jgi:decaprenyl-phosphate phosphoribosyltransferase